MVDKLSESLCDLRSCCCCCGGKGTATGTAPVENDVLDEVHVDEDDAEASVEVTCFNCRVPLLVVGSGGVMYGDDADETELEKSVLDELAVENEGFFIDDRRGGG